MPKLIPPENGVTVRMYRQGHGDCFLLAFPREGGGDPVYVLIDCGYKPGSPEFVHKKSIGEIVENINESTGGNLDLVVITHEHQDHLNGIWKKADPYFGPFTIGKAWLAWTESPTDALAKELRKRHHDQLLGLLNARNQLALAIGAATPAVKSLDGLLGFEIGGEEEDFDPAAMALAISDPTKSVNKQGLKLIKDKARENDGVEYFDPGGAPYDVPGTPGVKAYVLGPPKSEELLADEDPVGDEGFDTGDDEVNGLSFGAAAIAAAKNAAKDAAEGKAKQSPFRAEFHVQSEIALGPGGGFFADHYGRPGEGVELADKREVVSNADWRRIDEEWLYSAESLALKLNTGINNTSLVLAFELPNSKKVLLFAADAQRGNWKSWSKCEWKDGDKNKARDLLARTVLYKVGHHGSHNATLKGEEDSDYANLSWMGHGRFGDEFTAMITAVNKWAMTKNNPPWRHPLPSIRKALEEKTRGRLFQTDEDDPEQPDTVSDSEWKQFLDRTKTDQLYFDYQILDEA